MNHITTQTQTYIFLELCESESEQTTKQSISCIIPYYCNVQTK